MSGPDFALEHEAWSAGRRMVAGVDEAGRGPLAGPVIAAAVVFLEPFDIRGLDDSKRMTARRREEIFGLLMTERRVLVGVGRREPAEIDRLNILRATHEAMAEALAAVPDAGFALVDGLPVEGLPVGHRAIVGGDRRSISIAAASVVAKVLRDREMLAAAAAYPAYLFERHKGYPTPEHLAKLRAHGPCAIHRRSFAPVARAGRA